MAAIRLVIALIVAITGGLFYALSPMLILWLAPLCGNPTTTPLKLGQMLITADNTVICSSFEAMIKLSAAKSIVDLPPYVLVKNGCYPAPRVLVRVADVKGDLLALQLPRATDRVHKWWTTTTTTGADHTMRLPTYR